LILLVLNELERLLASLLEGIKAMDARITVHRPLDEGLVRKFFIAVSLPS